MILAPCIIPKFFDNNGQPLAKGLLFSYVAGATTKQTTYTDSTGGTPNTNPIVLDFRGECQLWLDTTKTYKFVLAPANDTDPPTNPIKTVDNVAGGYGGTIDWTQIVYDQTAAELAVSVNPAVFWYVPGDDPPGLVERFGTTGTSDDGPVINKAILAMQRSGGDVCFQAKTYNIQTPMNIGSSATLNGLLRMKGAGKRSTLLKWTGGSSVMLTVSASGNDGNTLLEDFSIDNTGSATSLIYVTSCRVVLNRLFTNLTTATSGPILSTNTAATVFDFVMRDTDFFVGSQSGCPATLVYLARGHTFLIDHCMLSGATSEVIKVGGAGAQPAQGVTIIGSRIEGFSGNQPQYPGSNNTLGINVVQAQGFNCIGSNFEMDGDQFAGANGQRAIKVTTCDGGIIHGNYMAGDGFADYMIELADVTAKGLDIAGNTFWRCNLGGVVASGTGSLLNNSIGINYSPGPTPRQADFSYTPVLTFTGGSGTLAYTAQGWARRVGDWIEYNGQVQLSAIGTAAGNPRLSAPVTSTNVTGNDTVFTNFAQSMSGVTTIQLFQQTNTNTIRMFNPSGTELTAASFTNASDIVFSGRIYSKI